MSKIDTLALATMAQGALQELFEHELDKVVNNIADPNTSIKKARKITIELKFIPTDESRDLVSIEITPKTTLAPTEGTTTKMVIGMNGDALVAVEYNNQIQGQMKIDEETGEVIEDNAFADNIRKFNAK